MCCKMHLLSVLRTLSYKKKRLNGSAKKNDDKDRPNTMTKNHRMGVANPHQMACTGKSVLNGYYYIHLMWEVQLATTDLITTCTIK